jgi:tetratricopeptide (TPR) repeat protein
MALEDIERLREKISRDPNSKLFVPLAEEYKKAGMLDEAIEVLTSGLENQPGYLSARVSLGKIFIDRGLLHEAQTEFEKVIGAIPDNLYAHKKLAEIYRDLGEKDKAVREFNMVLKLNPLDEWASTSLSEIELRPAPKVEELPSEEPAEAAPVDMELLQTDYEQTLEEPGIGVVPFPEEVPEEVHAETPSEFSIGGEESDAGETEVRAVSLSDEVLGAVPSEEVQESKDEEIPETSLSEEDMDIWKSHAESLSGAGEAEAETSLEEHETDLWKPLYETQGKAQAGADTVIEAEEVPMSAPAAGPETTAVTEEEALSFESVLGGEETVAGGGAPSVGERELRGDEGLTVGNADKYIIEGKYFSAMNIYRKILIRDTGNKQVLQRIEELRVLLKLLGKDKEELVSKLDSFLDSIRKRRDEFSGNT